MENKTSVSDSVWWVKLNGTYILFHPITASLPGMNGFFGSLPVPSSAQSLTENTGILCFA